MANKQWFKDAVVYQCYPQSFQDSNNDGIGDLNGITSRLDYIKKLGANVIWLNPIYKSPLKDNGYDIADYKSINPIYGTMWDFMKMLHGIHARGMHLLMDLVVNHTSDQCKWFQESKKSRYNKYSDYYIWRNPVNGHEPNNWGACFGGSCWTYVPARKQYYLHCFAAGQPDLNWENPNVRKSVYDIMKFWLDKGVDGFRMDVIDYISKPYGLPDGKVPKGGHYAPVDPMVNCGPKLADYLREMNEKVLSHYDCMTVGEMPGARPQDVATLANLDGKRLNMVFQFEHVSLSPNPNPRLGKWYDGPVDLVQLKHALSHWQTDLMGKAWNSLYWNNHDQPRAVSRFVDHADGPKYRVVAAKMLGTTLHMMQGTPYVFEGEELGMPNNHYTKLSQYEDLESINAYNDDVKKFHYIDGPTMLKYMSHMSRDNARSPMQWDDSKNAGFTKADKPWFAVGPYYKKINAKAELADKHSVFYYYQKLISIRHHSALVRYGDYKLLDPKDDEVFAYLRHYQGKTLLVMSNFTKKSVTRDYKQANADKLLIDNYDDDKGTTLRPFESKVYVFNK